MKRWEEVECGLTDAFAGGGWEDVSGVSAVLDDLDLDTKCGLELNRDGKTDGSFGGGSKQNAASLVASHEGMGELNSCANGGLDKNAAGFLGWAGREGG